MKLKDFLEVYDNRFSAKIQLFSRSLFKAYKYNYDKIDELLNLFGNSEIEYLSTDPYLNIIDITVY